MPKYIRPKEKPIKKRPSAPNRETQMLEQLHRSIFKKAALTVLIIVLSMAVIFAMSAAWYTNIVQTSGLVFKTEAWGFDGEIKVDETPVQAAPGEEGLVHLEVSNTGDSVVGISVNVSKAEMAEEMQKRFYFYVDTRMTRNGETMDRVYLNTREGYNYTVFNQNSLILTQERHNDAQIKWQWVYDVLGYYVLAQATETPEGKIVRPEEYLRPIEYDYDLATTSYETDADGNLVRVLKTVDGEKTPEQFLYELSKTDGYAGQIHSENKVGNYYPVDVDDNGYGVYAYLCSYGEIELATDYDTQLGKAAYDLTQGNATDKTWQDLTYKAKLTVTANQNDDRIAKVASLRQLEEKLKDGTADTIQLGDDLEITQTLKIPENTRIMLDLNGKTITAKTAENAAITLGRGSSLTMVNGTVSGEGTGYGVYSVGAEAVLHKVTIQNVNHGIYIADSDGGNALDSRIHLMNCQLEAESCAVFISGNGLASTQQTQLVIENSTLKSNSLVLSGNGSTGGDGRWGTDIQIIDSKLISNPDNPGAGIYLPQKNSTATIYHSEVSGYTGIAIKGGTVKLVDTTVTATGSKQEPAHMDSGFADTGDAVYVETGYGWDIRLEISGSSTLTAAEGNSLRVYDEDSTDVRVKLYGGTYDEQQPDSYIAPGYVQETQNNKTVVREQKTENSAEQTQ